ncbi:MAG: hypothetical protein JXA37_08895 [Chloroflexia bacterium]|nr:hypothetical protein [Chloroflexia bacterium]
MFAIFPLVACGLFWLLGLWQGWGWVGTAILLVFILAAAGGLLLNLGPGWMLLGLVAALVAWDLDHLSRRLHGAETETRRMLERAHILRLLPVVTAGLFLGGAAMVLRVRFGFGLALLLGLLLVVGLSRVLGSFAQR